MYINETVNSKTLKSPEYNYIFNKNNGDMAIWGKTKHDDSEMSSFGPVIFDIEITTKCDGIGDYGPCSFCYKSNTTKGKNMPFELYQQIIEKLPQYNKSYALTQLALGVDSKCESNPDTFKIMEYTRNKGIIPNITVADITEEKAEKIVSLCGACAVSFYGDKKICYNSIQKLKKYGLEQVNIHNLLAQETLAQTLSLIDDYKIGEEGLDGLNAIVFLSLKQKGRGKNLTPLTQQQFDYIVNDCIQNNIPIGFDSCSAPKFLKTMDKFGYDKKLRNFIQPCESTLESFYCDVDGNFYPCSFCEGVDDWKEGINVNDVDNFLKDVWYSEKVVNFRNKLLYNNRNCPIYNI